jgi:hypothetical protein
MNGHVLMERAGEQMNVPPEKIQAFLDDGWKVVNQPAAPAAIPDGKDAPALPVAPVIVSDVGKKSRTRSKK